ncbi:MAG: 4'-phosphopantetheinyl transferase superfamily protein, partial [Planctomycetes bacterium]|nr:4'-phosphopantetheinyl transferase superfamily protein [Planctomycetota bacterium]
LDAAFVRFWFSPAERSWCRQTRWPLASCAIWSFKESWYKAAHAGQPFAPRRIDMTRVAPVLRTSADEFSRADKDDVVLRGDPCTMHCRRLPHEIATLVLIRSERTEPAEPLPAVPLSPTDDPT